MLNSFPATEICRSLGIDLAAAERRGRKPMPATVRRHALDPGASDRRLPAIAQTPSRSIPEDWPSLHTWQDSDRSQQSRRQMNLALFGDLRFSNDDGAGLQVNV